MNLEKKKNTLFIIIILLLILPLFQEQTSYFNIKALKGSFEKDSLPELNLKDYYSGKFQENFNNYLEQNIGFRPFFIRVNNQIDFSANNKANTNWVVVGKNNYLYEQDYITSYLGKDFLGKEIIDDKIRKIKFLQDTLQKSGTKLLVIFAPGKGSFYPEYIPESFDPSNKTITNYEYYKKRSLEENINHIDFNDYFIKMKDTSQYCLFPKTGIHWSLYGVHLVVDSIKNYMEKSAGIKMPEMHFKNIEISSKFKGTDYDIEESMNLLFRIPNEKMAYPKIDYKSSPNTIKPKVLAIGDSYYWNIHGSSYASSLFKNATFWYYNKMAHSVEYDKPRKVEELNIKEEIEKQDFIILMATEPLLKRFVYGFVDNVYDIYSGKETISNSTNYSALYYEQQIRSDSIWLKSISLKAKEKGIGVDEMIKLDAKWLAEQKKN
ncbi:MAG: hypothetical protein K8R41_01490 [Bacteroidales bacterium]|nr:hypothetical protein [Bacteroidales bacterium]